MKTIRLGSKVIVSDPCYSLPTWCQSVVENVLSGNYLTNVRISDQEDWGERVSLLGAVHEDYIDKPFIWEAQSVVLGVDSGQLGIFDSYGYNSNEYAANNLSEFEGTGFFGLDDIWYDKISGLTVNDDWGTYPEGVVSRSGLGDGSYNLYLAKNEDGKVIGFIADFLIESETRMDEFNFIR